MPVSIRTVAIIGAGRHGRELALQAARAGYIVSLEDVLPVKLRNARELIDAQLENAALVNYVSTVEDAVRTADLAIDFVPDELESKLEIFTMIDRMAPPRTIICSPMKSMGLVDIASCTYRPTQCLAVHSQVDGATLLDSPLHLLRTADSNDDVVSAVQDFWQALGCEVSLEVSNN